MGVIGTDFEIDQENGGKKKRWSESKVLGESGGMTRELVNKSQMEGRRWYADAGAQEWERFSSAMRMDELYWQARRLW